ncbi:serine/threonine protein kinase [Leptolyngbya cf. ectocarpi LEGE 11479]|uniref:Serine/threonine protein kinase n=1 Tax=Leptolyngbya cf. ectocarpi LEGE 11479 TaxID=1828722 RepID=A0A929F9R6_LEPEC|nr:serine/threonine-protein kinase [Leptolyngbya ectocarpi]MBE9069995.1 serine/threonine protein kinase [Leptolyngbya cf. ectocarpi LEGE 11479]
MTSPTDSSLKFGLPDFSEQGFQVKSELGANRAGGRITYLAIHLKTGQRVVIKQFQIAGSSHWGGYEALRQEAQVLKSLEHPGIPRYLGVFRSDDGVCMVQEYKRAESLAKPRSFSPDAIREIAIACLEILVYLQNRIPPIIHRDFKPANILVSKSLDVYLVDFGFARIGDGEVGVSSVVKGTLGFMPPEQIFNRQLTEASDLYGLGMTLMCLISNTPADQVGTLVDVTYQVDFEQLKANVSSVWIQWLKKMVDPRLEHRFANAMAALDAVPDHGLRQPQTSFSTLTIDLTAHTRGETLTTDIQLTNAVPETTLTGTWQVAAHDSDPEPIDGHHRWIDFSPVKLQGNDVTTQLHIDTSQLMTGKTYQRTLLFNSNAQQSVKSLNLTVQTAPSPLQYYPSTPYGLLLVLFGVCWITVRALSALTPEYTLLTPAIYHALFLLALFGNGLGLQMAGWLLHEAKLNSPAARVIMFVGAIAVALMGPLYLLLNVRATDSATAVITIGLSIFSGTLLGILNGFTIEGFWRRGFKPAIAIGLSLGTGLLGILLGLIHGFALSTPWMIFSLIANAIGIGTMLTYLPVKRAQAIALHRRSMERRLIRP